MKDYIMMRIYFDGCAKTGGYSRTGRIDKRYPKLLCEKLGAEEYNIAQRNGNNKRIVRNLLEHNLSDFDLFVIQMTKRNRFEYYDREERSWISIGYLWREFPRVLGHSELSEMDYVAMKKEKDKLIDYHTIWQGDVVTINDVPITQRHKERYKINKVSDEKRKMIEYYLHYFRKVYTEEQSKIDEQMCFSTMKHILRNHKHIIMYMHSDKEVHVPVDLIYKRGKDYVSGYYMGTNTHQIIMNDILKLL